MNLKDLDYEYLFGRTIPDVRYETDSNGNVIFEQLFKTGTATSSTDGVICAYFYDINNNITFQKIRLGVSWDNRASIT